MLGTNDLSIVMRDYNAPRRLRGAIRLDRFGNRALAVRMATPPSPNDSMTDPTSASPIDSAPEIFQVFTDFV